MKAWPTRLRTGFGAAGTRWSRRQRSGSSASRRSTCRRRASAPSQLVLDVSTSESRAVIRSAGIGLAPSRRRTRRGRRPRRRRCRDQRSSAPAPHALEVLEVLELERVGLVVGEAAVRLEVEAPSLRNGSWSSSRRVGLARDAVARVDHDAQFRAAPLNSSSRLSVVAASVHVLALAAAAPAAPGRSAGKPLELPDVADVGQTGIDPDRDARRRPQSLMPLYCARVVRRRNHDATAARAPRAVVANVHDRAWRRGRCRSTSRRPRSAGRHTSARRSASIPLSRMSVPTTTESLGEAFCPELVADGSRPPRSPARQGRSRARRRP